VKIHCNNIIIIPKHQWLRWVPNYFKTTFLESKMDRAKLRLVFPMPKGYSSVLEAKRTMFWKRCGLRDFKSLFLGGLHRCLQNLISTRHIKPWKKHQFALRCILKFTYKGHFKTKKKALLHILKIQTLWTYFGGPSTQSNSFWKKKSKLPISSGISKFLMLIFFGPIWADFVATAVAGSMP
jgi:hypothetical protein